MRNADLALPLALETGSSNHMTLPNIMAVQGLFRPIPLLEPFIVHNVEPTGVELGIGAYGAVEEVRLPGAICAAKKMHEILLRSATPEEQEIMSDTFLRECTLLSRLRHPHIVQFLGVCYLPGSRLPLLVMERLFTSLDGLLENKDVVIPFDAKLSFLRDVANGLIFLHGQTPPVIHRDLTARNVLLNAAMVAKIADLGVARIVNLQPGKIAATMTRNPGNVVYMPPEAAEDTARYSAALDMFSYGNLTIFTLTRTFPDLKAATYYDSKSGRVIARTEVERRDEVFVKTYEEFGKGHPLVRLSKQCLSNNPAERPTANQALQQLARVNSTDGKWQKTKLGLLQDVAIAETERVAKERDVNELNDKVAGYEKRIDDLEIENLSLHKVIESLNEELQLLRKELDDKDAKNEALERQNQILQYQLMSQLKQQEKRGRDDTDLKDIPQHLKESSSAEVLRKSLSFLYQHLDPDKVIPVLTEKSLLDTTKVEELSSYQHTTARSMALVNRMFKSTVSTFTLLDTLKMIPGQEYIGTRLAQEIKDVVLEKKTKSFVSVDDIASQFHQLFDDLVTAFEKHPNGVPQLKKALASLVLPLCKGKEAVLVQPSVYQDAQTTRQLIECMSPYFHYLSMDLLQLLVHLSGCDTAATLVDDFVITRANNRHLVLFNVRNKSPPSVSSPVVTFDSFHNIPTDALQPQQPLGSATIPKPQAIAISKDMIRVSVLVNRSLLCLSDYDDIVTALCGFFQVPKAVLSYVDCAEQPCMLSWVVSAPVYEYMKSAEPGVSGELMVAQERIISIAVGQDVKYDCLTIEENELQEACFYGLVEKVQKLLKLKFININVKDYDGFTPLHSAGKLGSERIIQLLVQAGVNVNVKNNNGWTLLHSASQDGHEKIVQLLIQARANVNLQSNDGWTPLKEACFGGHVKVVELLLVAGARVDLVTTSGFTPLMLASVKGHKKVVELLLSAGAEADVQDMEGYTSLYAASEIGHKEIVQLLIQAGANVNLPNSDGLMPLMIACTKGHENVVKVLLAAGAKVNVHNKWSETALYLARQNGHQSICKLLQH